MRSVAEMTHDIHRRIRLMRRVGADIGGRAEAHMLAAADFHESRTNTGLRALVTASQAAASGSVVDWAPRTWAVRWMYGPLTGWHANADGDACPLASVGFYGDPDLRPCWDAAARVWRWGSPACDPRGCAWPRPWMGGEVRRG